MRTVIIILLLAISLGFTVFSSVKLISTTAPTQAPQGHPFNLNFTETIVVDRSGTYLVKLTANSTVKSLYVIAILDLSRGDHRTIVLTLSSPLQVVHLHKGIYEVQFYATGITNENISKTQLEQIINLTVMYQGEHDD
ncbi:hypothetical protein L3N51_00633 [Metallosphaera sp. J1]|uniref:hypothetical protein n=1 Tax=Metallosphaera javensis (ex Hofmann et al. 2022) TaxID=99938 RepID=UPI001EE13D09|nr:hypothetical protein [Metallosphaera javensis (ex Hofmann et al. 2022)]MCG3108352.1 hypothetical protein [Metallosphaera javensis (ex Hofmann et al. 2022)]